MGFLQSIFRRKQENITADRISITVLYATARDGLSYEKTLSIQKVILDAQPIHFYFLNPGSFEVYFAGTEEGMLRSTQLATALKEHASQSAVSLFGVAVRTGLCIVAIDSEGNFAQHPVGHTINEAMIAAIHDASENVG